MGNGSSIESTKVVYLDINGRQEKIAFSRHSSTRDVVELLAQASGSSKYTEFTLKNQDGAHVPIAPTMPTNSPLSAYVLHAKQSNRLARADPETLNTVLSQFAEQFNKAFKIEELKNDMTKRLTTLEKRMETEGMKGVEIDKCKRDIGNIKEQIYQAHRKMIDYNHLSENPVDNDNVLVKLRKKCVPTFQKYTLSDETTSYLKQPTFDIWYWEPNEMLSLLEHMYHDLGVVTEFSINPITLKRWLLCVQENYRNNPFHNFRHCFCVTQMMYGMIQLCKLWESMSREDLGILLTACVCHDLDHPGYNNTYQINARTELAIRYNDISPLENHHCAVAFKILNNPETNIFANVDQNTFKRIRAAMITLVLATDMARHGEIMDTFKSKLENFDFSSEEHLNSLKMVMIKCCDISNEVRPMEVSEPWVDCLLEEYFNQSDREKQEGLPVAPFMDRDKVTKPTAQIGFIKFVLIPMFETVAKLFPMVEDTLVNPLRDARDHYEALKKTEEAERATSSSRPNPRKNSPTATDEKGQILQPNSVK